MAREKIDLDKVLEKVKLFHLQKKGIYFEDHPAILKAKKENLVYSIGFLHIEVAKSWKMIPSELSERTTSDLEDMYAYYIAEQQIEIVKNYETWQSITRMSDFATSGYSNA